MINSSSVSRALCDDLSISSYLNPSLLPANLRDAIAAAEAPAEKDILLLSILTAAGAALHHLSFRYGRMVKRYYPNLQTFIVAGSASGKGIATLALDMLRPIINEYPLLLPSDSTYPAFFQSLQEQGGIGYMHESEGSVITDIWRNATMNYNAALRKAAEHEPLSRNRYAEGKCTVECPRLSCLLTGTFSQFHALVPSVENGFFSRLCLLVVRDRLDFDKRVFASNTLNAQDIHLAISRLGNQLLHLYQALQAQGDVLFRLTDEQAMALGEHFSKEYHALLQELGENFHPSVVRMGITAMRIAAILTALRKAEQPEELAHEWTCCDNDFHTATLISSKLLLHAADAFMQINGKKQVAVPKAKTRLQLPILLEMLPKSFKREEVLPLADVMGITHRTLDRHLHALCMKGLLETFAFASYKKVGQK